MLVPARMRPYSRRRRSCWRRRSAGAWPRSRSVSRVRPLSARGRAEHLADEGHGEASLRRKRRFIQGVEQLVERAHVARKALAQPVPGLIGQLEAAQPRAQREGGVLLLLIERAQLKHRARGATR